MTSTLALALLLVAAFAWYAPRHAPALPPRTATYLLAGGAVIATGVTAAVLAMAAATAVAQLPPVASLGDWSRANLHESDPVPVWLAAGCAALLDGAAIRGARHATQRVAALRRLHRDCRGAGRSATWSGAWTDDWAGIAERPGAGERVIVIDSPRPEAYATPAGGGRIVITTGLLTALPIDEQRVLLAHESAHLHHWHTWWVLAADLCAAANPLLHGVAHATVQATERWADECAAATVGDRELAARAVARAALHVSRTAPGRRPPLAAAVGGQVPQRVHALLAPPPRPHRVLTAGLALLLVAGLGCTLAVQRRTDTFFDLANTGDSHAYSAPAPHDTHRTLAARP